MSKFLSVLEQFDPNNTEDPKWKLVDFLKSKGINVSLVNNTDMIHIDTGESTITVNVSETDEDAENPDPDYNIDSEVENLGNKAASGLTGLAARAWGTSAQKAKQAVKKRQQVAGQAVGVYDQKTKDIEKSLTTAKRKPITTSY